MKPIGNTVLRDCRVALSSYGDIKVYMDTPLGRTWTILPTQELKYMLDRVKLDTVHVHRCRIPRIRVVKEE